MLRFKLRTLLILLAILPPVVAIIAPPLVQSFKKKPPPAPATAANPNAPYFASYDLPADPQFAEKAIRALMAGTPINMQLDSKTGKLEVWGSPKAHRLIQAIIGEIQRNSWTVTTSKDGSVLIETPKHSTKK
jgi:hypothetical protein